MKQMMNNTKKFALMLFLGCVCILNAQETKTPKVDAFDFGKGLKIEMVLIPAGKFQNDQKGSFALQWNFQQGQSVHP